MKIPYPYRKESRLFTEALLNVVHDTHKQQISQYISRENIHSFHHGRGWLTVREDRTEESTLGEAGIELAFEYSSIVDNDVQMLFDFVDNFIEGFTSQVISKMYQTISDACDKSGNVVKQSDHSSKAEAFMEMLKTIEFSVNENGQVEFPQLHVDPNGAKELINELNQQSPAFHEEIEQIKRDKSKAAIEKEKIRLSKYKAINL